VGASPRVLTANSFGITSFHLVGRLYPMIGYEDLVEIARICLEQARKAGRAAVKNELEYTRGYQLRAASMRHGQIPDIGEHR
jgi:hypothetical protein